MSRLVEVTELALRDGHQSLLATRMALEDMVPACEAIDQAAFFGIDPVTLDQLQAILSQLQSAYKQNHVRTDPFPQCATYFERDPASDRNGVNLGNETMLRLAELPNIVGVKDCSADAAQSFDLLRLKPDGFSVLTGEDALLDRKFLAQVAHGQQLAARYRGRAVRWCTHAAATPSRMTSGS